MAFTYGQGAYAAMWRNEWPCELQFGEKADGSGSDVDTPKTSQIKKLLQKTARLQEKKRSLKRAMKAEIRRRNNEIHLRAISKTSSSSSSE